MTSKTNRKLDRSAISQALENAGLDPECIYESYSGRAMYGDRCFGIAVDALRDAFVFFATLGESAYAADIDDELGQSTADLASSARTDDLGRGLIVYFPGFELTSED